MNTNDAVSTYQLFTRLTVQLCLFGWVSGTKQCLLERRDKGGYISGQGVQVDKFMGFVFVPILMDFLAALAQEPTGAAEANSFVLLALVTHCLFAGAHFLEGILDVKEVVDVERSLEPWDSAHRQQSVLATLWT